MIADAGPRERIARLEKQYHGRACGMWMALQWIEGILRAMRPNVPKHLINQAAIAHNNYRFAVREYEKFSHRVFQLDGEGDMLISVGFGKTSKKRKEYYAARKGR